MPFSCFSRNASGDTLKLSKGGESTGPAILPFDNSSWIFVVTSCGCCIAVCELLDAKGVSIPSKCSNAPCLNMFTISRCLW